MGEESDRLEAQINHARYALGHDIDVVQDKVRDAENMVREKVQDVETKVRNTLDWRYQFRERPSMLIGVAFGVGALLSLLMSSRRSSSRRERQYQN